MKNIPKVYKVTFIICITAVFILSSIIILPRTTIPIEAPDRPESSDYLFYGMLSLGRVIIFTIIFAAFLSVFQLWIWSLVDLAKSTYSEKNDKLFWLFILILLPVIGALLYAFIGVKKKIPEPQTDP